VSHEVERLTAELNKMRDEKAETDRRHAADIENRTTFLVDKNQSLKDTILSNNEKYSKKVQDLSEKYTALEKANVELRKNLASKEKVNMEVKQNSTKNSSDTPSSVKVQIDKDTQGALLYEV
jgi:DNA uptake protein ComE-like DNA-binding protein